MTGGHATQKQQNITWAIFDVIIRTLSVVAVGATVHQFVLEFRLTNVLITAGTTTGIREIREQEKPERRTKDVPMNIPMGENFFAMVHHCVNELAQKQQSNID